MFDSIALYGLTFTVTTKVICRYHIEKMISNFDVTDRTKMIVMMLDDLPKTAKEMNIDDKTVAIYRQILLDLSKQYKSVKTEV